jgi:serine/threonine-protein kinase RsbW
MSESVVRLSFPAKPDYLLLARLALTGIVSDAPVDDELLAELKIAVTEACGNVVRHAYPEGKGDVSISYLVTDQTLEVSVEDQGRGVDLEQIEAERPAGPIDGGMGMSIMRTIVDELDIHAGADGRGTVVRMTKRLVPAGA